MTDFAPDATVDPFALAADMLDPPGGGVEKYYDDPAGFVRDCIRWSGDRKENPTDYQERNMRLMVEKGRVCVRGPHGLGKSTTAAWLILWFALTRDARGVDWKIITTASAWRQLEKFLWPEVRKWSMRLRWGTIGREPFTQAELMRLGLRLTHGEAVAVACEDPATIEGAHADSLLYVYDEAKRLDVSTPIPTPTGWTSMGELEVGDEVLDEAGFPTKVTYVSPIIADAPCSRVTFADGASLIADDGHLWSTISLRRRQIAGATHANDPRYKRKYPGVHDWREHWDLSEVVETADLRDRTAIPTCGVLDLPEVDLPIDPYVLGAWLGDGHSLHGAVTTMDPEVIERFALAGHPPTREDRKVSRATTYGVAGLRTKLRENDLLANKHIPSAYLRASAEQRLELLRGLMDTDGTVMARDARVSFTTTTPALAEGVAELARSFGWKVQIRTRPGILNGVEKKLAYRLRWSADLCCFHIPRKAQKWRGRGAQASAATIRAVERVERVPSVPTRCIAVDSPRHLYLAGEDFIPTHNTIPEATYDASEGAFSGAGEETGQEAFAIASSTPGVPAGRFYDIQTRKTGLEDWTPVHVSQEEVIAAGRMGKKWAAQKLKQWGANSAVYINRVLGNFAASEEDGVIALAWVEAANERWLKWAAGDLDLPVDGDGVPVSPLVNTARAPMEGVHGLILDHDEQLAKEVTCLGQDVAEAGGDKTIIAVRYGMVIGELRRCPRGDPIESARYAHHALENTEGDPPIVVDKIGVGAGTVAQLRVLGHHVIPFDAREKTSYRDQSQELEFANLRAAAWWRMRDLLDPTNGHEVALPPDDSLTGDLTAPTWKQHTNGKLLVESKDDLRKRLGRSTDDGDAVVQAFWVGAHGNVTAPIFTTRTSRWSPMSQTADGGGYGGIR